MNPNVIEKCVHELFRLSDESDVAPFPYDGCRRILKGAGDEYEGFIPDLDMYFYKIYSQGSGIHLIVERTPEKLLDAKDRFTGSFFDNHPRFKPLAPLITEDFTPDLYRELANHERRRILLLRIISQLLTEQGNPEWVYPIERFLKCLRGGMGWLAVGAEDYKQVALAAGLRDCRDVPFREGIRLCSSTRHIGLVTPPFEGWVLVFGLWLLTGITHRDFKRKAMSPLQKIVCNLSSKFGEAQAFGSSSYHIVSDDTGLHWMRARQGELFRSFVYTGGEEGVVQNIGEPGRAERNLDVVTSSPTSAAKPDNVLAVAREWSVDPIVACLSLSEGEGVVGTAPLP